MPRGHRGNASGSRSAPLFGYLPAVSLNGRYVGFTSAATNLVRGDTNGVNDIFVRFRGA